MWKAFGVKQKVEICQKSNTMKNLIFSVLFLLLWGALLVIKVDRQFHNSEKQRDQSVEFITCFLACPVAKLLFANPLWLPFSWKIKFWDKILDTHSDNIANKVSIQT